jgi:hypothetical protein
MYHGVSNNKIQYRGKWKYAIDTKEDREMSVHQNSGICDKLYSEFLGFVLLLLLHVICTVILTKNAAVAGTADCT